MTFNASRTIDGFLTSLLAQSYVDFTLYLTDNSSSDRTLEQVAKYHDPRICIFRNDENLGWARAANRGIQAALADGCPLIMLMNDDTEFEAHLTEKLVEGLNHHSCDMIVPKILFFENQKMIWSAGGTFKRWRGNAPSHYGVFQIDRGQFDTPRPVEHGPACCLLLRRQVFERVGILDNRFFLCLDDADLCYRAMLAGFRLIYLPSAVLLHKASSSTGGPTSDTNARYGTRSQVIYMLKHLGFWRALFFLHAYQAHLVVGLLTGRMGVSRFFLREKAFFEGLRIWKQSASQVAEGSLSCEISRV